jgi:hypothetical protein
MSRFDLIAAGRTFRDEPQGKLDRFREYMVRNLSRDA